MSTTAVDEPKRHTPSAVNIKAATAAGAKTATPLARDEQRRLPAPTGQNSKLST
jgi:hypothetical protein